jgi:hypothetical protein
VAFLLHVTIGARTLTCSGSSATGSGSVMGRKHIELGLLFIDLPFRLTVLMWRVVDVARSLLWNYQICYTGHVCQAQRCHRPSVWAKEVCHILLTFNGRTATSEELIQKM